MKRLERVSHAAASALRLLPTASEPGFPLPGEIAACLARTFRASLGPNERLTLTCAGMLSLNSDDAEELAEATLCDLRAGAPVPPFTSVRDDARDWAALSSHGEMRAYLSAIWNRLPDAERASFLKAVRPNLRAAA